MSFRYVNIPRREHSFLNKEKKIYKPRDDNVKTKSLRRMTKDCKLSQCHDSLYNVEHNSWFTVIPLHDIHISCENIRVKLNPLCRSLIIKVKSTDLMTDGRVGCVGRVHRVRREDEMNIYKPLKYVVKLPKHILMDKLQVKLTQHEELVICAPFKYPQQHETRLLTLNEETLNSRFLRDKKMRNEFNWINIPIIAYSTTSFNKRCYKNELQLIDATSSSLSSSSSSSPSSSSSSSSSSEDEVSELEWTTTDEELNEKDEKDVFSRRRRFSHIRHLDDMKVFVKKYVDLLKDIFYPNLVQVKILPLDVTTTSTTSSRNRLTSRRMKDKDLKNFQLVLCVKFDEYKSDDFIVRVDTVNGKRVLIVEGKNIHKCSNVQSNCMKDIRYVIPLPFIFNVDKMMYNVLPNGVVTMKLPILTKKMRDLYGFDETVDSLEKKDLYKHVKY